MSRIEELADEVAALQGRISGLEHRLSAMERSHPPRSIPRPVSAPDREGVSVTTMAPPLPDAPTVEEAARLVALVTAKYPQVRFREVEPDAAKFAEQVRRAMIGLSTLGRREEPDTNKFPSYWVEEVEAALRALQVSPDIGEGLLCAAIASADIRFAFAPHRAPALGLNIAGGGTPARPRWRAILSGDEPVPNAVAYPNVAA